MLRLSLVTLLLGCGPQTVPLRSAVYGFEGLRGRSGTPSAAVTGATLEYDALTREVKLTVGSATRRFVAGQASSITVGCQGNFGGQPQETRTLDAPNLQLAELLFDAPLLRSDCPEGSGVIVLQSGPSTSSGGAPDCSEAILCSTWKRR